MYDLGFRVVTRQNNNINEKLVIVAIDDEELCLESLDMCFMSYNRNFDLILIKNSNFGLKYIKENHSKIDLVILDLMMPEISGLEILEFMRTQDDTKNISVIISTANSDDDIKDKCIGLNAIYLNKPYNRHELLNLVEKSINCKAQNLVDAEV